MLIRRICLSFVCTLLLNAGFAMAAPPPPEAGVSEKASCTPGVARLCLNNDRFRVTLNWRDGSGNRGTGQAVRLTADTGYFWFFNSSNVEVVVKVLDGRNNNGHFWVFYGSLSNVRYTITVTDTVTNKSKTYVNPLGRQASLADTQAFAAKSSSGAAALIPEPVHPAPVESSIKAGNCTPTTNNLCLNDNRFSVDVVWKDFAGNRGAGRAVPLTPDTGYFVFFSPNNVELVVKVLDGRGFNGHFWVFYGSLSNVEFDITVRDTETGEVRVFSNPSGNLASAAETSAFNANQGPFVSGLSLEPGTIFAGEATPVTFSAALRGGISRPSQLQVRRTSGGQEAQVLNLFDDGDLAKGDDIAGDGLYNNRLVLQPGDEKDLTYYARVEQTGARTSDRRLVVTGRLNSADFSRNVNLSASLENLYRQAVNNGSTPQQAAQQVVNQLAARPGEVRIYGKTSASDGVWWVSKEGVLSAVVPSTVRGGQQRSGAGSGRAAPEAMTKERKEPPQILLFPAPGSNTGSGLAAGAKDGLKADENEIGSNLALVLAPFYWQFEFEWGSDESDEIASLLRNNGFQVTEKQNVTSSASAISIEDFKSLAQYGQVVITSHGDNFYDGLATLWIGAFGESIPFWVSNNATQVVVLTGVQATEANRTLYEKDLKAQRLVLAGDSYAITPSFISYYNGTFPNSLIYIGSCRSTFNSSLAQVFLTKGAGAYLGYSDYVGSGFAFDHGTSLFDQMVTDGKKTGEVAGVGDVENSNDKARFDLFGADDLVVTSGLRNGDFEIGSLSGWQPEGDTRIITSLGPLGPPQGTYMAILSTGLGSVSNSQSRIFQQFRVPQNANTLTFRYNVISEEPLEFVGSQFDDQFEVNLTRGASVQRLAAERVNASSWSPIAGIDFSGGDNTVFQTGWKNVSVNLSAHRGQLVTLEVRVFDVGDSIYDTAAVIDNFKIQ